MTATTEQAPPDAQQHITPPPTPPAWAQRSTPEDGGIVHETTSPLQPAVRRWEPHGSSFEPTTVSLSSVDLHIDGMWIRTIPTIQIEGGSYTLDDIHQLRDAIDTLLHHAHRDTPSADNNTVDTASQLSEAS